jgi:hypothetical protein
MLAAADYASRNLFACEAMLETIWAEFAAFGSSPSLRKLPPISAHAKLSLSRGEGEGTLTAERRERPFRSVVAAHPMNSSARRR